MGEYHARERLYFERGEMGQVLVKMPDKTVILASNEWASVLASMCARGENAQTFEEADDFHRRES